MSTSSSTMPKSVVFVGDAVGADDTGFIVGETVGAGVGELVINAVGTIVAVKLLKASVLLTNGTVLSLPSSPPPFTSSQVGMKGILSSVFEKK